MTTTPRKRKPVNRSLAVLQPMGLDGTAVIRLTVGKDVDTYTVSCFPADFGEMGVAWEKADGTVYHVHLDGERSTCDCPGGQHGGHCKHRDASRWLADRGQLQLVGVKAPANPAGTVLIDLDNPTHRVEAGTDADVTLVDGSLYW